MNYPTYGLTVFFSQLNIGSFKEFFENIELFLKKLTYTYIKDQFDREVLPRMPWRDEGIAFLGESARDLARHFIQRWNQCKVNNYFN